MSTPSQQPQASAPQQPSMSPQDLKRRIKELEEENCQLALRLTRAGRHVNRLRLERKLLLERLEVLVPQQQPVDTGLADQKQNDKQE